MFNSSSGTVHRTLDPAKTERHFHLCFPVNSTMIFLEINELELELEFVSDNKLTVDSHLNMYNSH